MKALLMILAILCSAITVAEELWIPGQSQSSIGDWATSGDGSVELGSRTTVFTFPAPADMAHRETFGVKWYSIQAKLVIIGLDNEIVDYLVYVWVAEHTEEYDSDGLELISTVDVSVDILQEINLTAAFPVVFKPGVEYITVRFTPIDTKAIAVVGLKFVYESKTDAAQ